MNYEEVVRDIKYGRIYSSTLSVYTALEALAKLVRECRSKEELKKRYIALARELVRARPTSAMLSNAIRDLTETLVDALRERGFKEVDDVVESKVEELKRGFEENNRLASQIASRRLESGDAVLTVSYSKLVLETFKLAAQEGKALKIYVTESRPGSEGFELAIALVKLGFDVTVLVDSATRYVMKEIDRVLVGAEAIAANGALVNKVGTSLVALAAHEARVRLFTVAPTHKISPETFLGEIVELAEASPESLAKPPAEVRDKVKVWAPLFDVTPPEYVDAIITEKGLVAPQAIPLIAAETYGWPPSFKTIDETLRELEGV